MQNGPPKGHLSSRDAFGYTRGQKTPVRLNEFQFPEIGFTKTTEVALSPFTFRLSLLYLFLNVLPSKDKGVVVVLPPGDSSSNWTNHPTAVVCLPSWC
ncbi:hypothetical protein AVEN_43852-1 [Araneus ventricosus]|uniref:Uncharacterized protein n=1 Tax=Araneus ventricosus TaxID=182803 RepID=A0A4Y2TSG7_ARAVE|nr:hypothetical protein AVEN_72903-1 [Araneus ventricosus]GBO02327.1 hypothetical protein AVEN_43852-1 [Araneus ventricosus]